MSVYLLNDEDVNIIREMLEIRKRDIEYTKVFYKNKDCCKKWIEQIDNALYHLSMPVHIDDVVNVKKPFDFDNLLKQLPDSFKDEKGKIYCLNIERDCLQRCWRGYYESIFGKVMFDHYNNDIEQIFKDLLADYKEYKNETD